MVFPPTIPESNIPMHLSIGAMKNQPVVTNGKIEIAPCVNISANIDHRYMDATQGIRLANKIETIMNNPFKYFEASIKM